MRRLAALLCTVSLSAWMACASDPAPHQPSTSDVGEVPPEPQRDGDATKGYESLVTEGYVGCGVPYSAYVQAFGDAPPALRLPGRTGHNERLPYNFTAFEAPGSGVEVVSPNCLQCHAETFDGEVIIGLGNHTADYTFDASEAAVLSGALISDPVERDEWQRWVDRMVAIAPFTQTKTIGVNPADNLAAALFAHRDPETLAWYYEPLLELPPPVVVPVDVPPWWNMKKKNAMFYVAAGRGDHARIMMTASTLCIDTVEDARAIDDYFPDVRSYILSLEAPAYPFDVDEELAATGKQLFEDGCSSCHGTYGEGGEYPNLVVAAEEVGTDDTLALGVGQFGGVFVDWFNDSFFGELSRLAPAPGYIAPPLDGIWASAPYFHNGSVPTLRGVLDSTSRPTYWTRSFSTDAGNYSQDDVGWKHTVLAAGQDSEPSEANRIRIYDTTQLGYGNGGHDFGDGLSVEERDAVLEYLKTL